jgi:hypothetical protein
VAGVSPAIFFRAADTGAATRYSPMIANEIFRYFMSRGIGDERRDLLLQFRRNL